MFSFFLFNGLHASQRYHRAHTCHLFQLLACIGEQLPNEDEVTGAVVSVRKVFFRISVWTRTSNNKEVLEAIGYAKI